MHRELLPKSLLLVILSVLVVPVFAALFAAETTVSGRAYGHRRKGASESDVSSQTH
jgi:hypothetical protein